MISPSERDFLRRGIEMDVRVDGRSRMDVRECVQEIGLLPQANGSCRLRTYDGSEVLVGVKMEIGEPLPERPNEGRITCHVECSPGAALDVPGVNAGALVDDWSNDWTCLLGKVLQQPSVLDYRQLSIIPREKCWILHVDVTILGKGGNLVDLLFMATRAALYNVRIPRLMVEASGEGGNTEFELLEDDQAMIRLNVEQIPLCVTMHKIGDRFVVDASAQEEECSDVRLHAAVDRRGHVLLVQKSGSGSLAPSIMTSMIQASKKVSLVLLKQHDQVLQEDDSRVEKSGYLI